MFPEYIDFEEIYITLGSPWIPTEIIDSFISQMYRLKATQELTVQSFDFVFPVLLLLPAHQLPSSFLNWLLYLEEIRDEDYDGIIIAYSCFERIKLSVDYRIERLKTKKAELENEKNNNLQYPRKIGLKVLGSIVKSFALGYICSKISFH